MKVTVHKSMTYDEWRWRDIATQDEERLKQEFDTRQKIYADVGPPNISPHAEA